MTSVDEFLSGTKGRSAKFPTIGTTVKGEIVDSRIVQQRDFDSGDLLFWPDGNPKNQLVISVQTDQQDDEEDDGIRNIYLKGSKKNALSGLGAVAKALGKNRLEIGGTLAIRYTGDGEKPARGNAPKQYAAKYEPPVAQPGGFEDEEEPF